MNKADILFQENMSLRFGNEKYELSAGDTYSIPGNQIHSFNVIEGGEVVDVFTPPREDYL